jgi:two-component system LytT family response regulator
MSLADTLHSTRWTDPRWPRQLALGAAYWLAFLLLLEPGNIAAALDADRPLTWEREALRILVATLMGAAATPPLLWLVDRYPAGAGAWRRLGLHAAACAGLAAGLIVLANPMAAWLLEPDSRPLMVGLRQDLAADWPLMTYAMALFVALAHGLRRRARPTPWLTHLTVTARGRQTRLALADVDWIETQGNYLALHASGQVHLVRETSRRLEARLDPDRFLRIHRRIIVALDRAECLSLLDGGDAELTLRGGTILRVSRSHRRALRSRML